jgi:enoyl-CoA hydratase
MVRHAVARTGEILCEVRGRAGIVTLNRPDVLNSLNLSMLGQLRAQLLAWASDARVATVVVRGAGDRAFCAGGDVRAVFDARGDAAFMDRVYRVEYELDEYISRYPKPYVALMSGYTMGGGCGISIHGRHRVVTESTVLAMPEVAIGLFPDVGASCPLSRCPGALGLYLGLTGRRIGGADAIHLGLADRMLRNDALDALVDALVVAENAGAALAALALPTPASSLAPLQREIDACFGQPSVSAILAALRACPSEWARDAERAMRAASPTSLEITFRAIREAREKSLRDCLVTDFRVAQRLMLQSDYFEGTRALIIDKDRRPQWRPASLADVDPRAVDACFAPLEGRELAFA